MEAAGLALSVVATVDICLKYGKILVDTCKSFGDAEAQLHERIVCVKIHWNRSRVQLEFLQQIWQSLDAEHQAIQSEILDILISKLKIAVLKLERLKNPSRHSVQGGQALMKRTKFVFLKESLDEVIQDLARWQEMFDPSWFLIMKIPSRMIDEELSRRGPHDNDNKSEASIKTHASGFRDAARRDPLQTQSIFLPSEGLKSALVIDVLYSSAKVVQRAGSQKWLVVETILCDAHSDSAVVTRNIRNLARKLSCENPNAFGILQCQGVVRLANETKDAVSSFDFVFKIPKQLAHKSETLRETLVSRTSHSLTERFGFAHQLARSISYIHTLGFVHKNVRPESLLGFPSLDSNQHRYFLVGFNMMRMADGRTLRRGDLAWEKNLYRHPYRQGLEPAEIYTMQHDIYSLGVCLLEIGLWDSFVTYQDTGESPVPGAALGLSSDSLVFRRPMLMKDHLVSTAAKILPERMGEKYADIVVNCLTCLDDDNLDFGDESEFKDEDEIIVGVRYIEKVLLKLDSISV